VTKTQFVCYYYCINHKNDVETLLRNKH